MKNAWAVTLSMNNSVIHWLECRFIQINIYCLLKYSLYIKSPSILSVYLIVIIMVSSTLMRKVPPILYFFNSSFPLDETAQRSNIFHNYFFFLIQIYIHANKIPFIHAVSTQGNFKKKRNISKFKNSHIKELKNSE